MELIQQIHRDTRTNPGDAPEGGANVTEALARAQRLADAADDLIDRVCSGEAEAFLSANRQAGGQ